MAVALLALPQSQLGLLPPGDIAEESLKDPAPVQLQGRRLDLDRFADAGLGQKGGVQRLSAPLGSVLLERQRAALGQLVGRMQHRVGLADEFGLLVSDQFQQRFVAVQENPGFGVGHGDALGALVEEQAIALFALAHRMGHAILPGHIPEDGASAHDPALVVPNGGGAQLHLNDGVGLGLKLQFDIANVSRPLEFLERRLRPGGTGGVQQIEHGPPHDLGPRAAGARRQRPVAGHNDATGGVHRAEQVRRVIVKILQFGSQRLKLGDRAIPIANPAAHRHEGAAQARQPQQPDHTVAENRRVLVAARDRMVGLHRNGDAQPAANIALLVALRGVAAETALLGDQRQDHPELPTPLHQFLGHDLFSVRSQLFQSGRFPSVGGVLRPDRIQARHVTIKMLLQSQFVDLTGHVGRIDQGEAASRRCRDVALHHVSQIRIGRRLFGDRNVNSAMHRGPVTIK